MRGGVKSGSGRAVSFGGRLGGGSRWAGRRDATRSVTRAERLQEELAAEWPDDDVSESLEGLADFYIRGSKPRVEEDEYLQALDGIRLYE